MYSQTVVKDSGNQLDRIAQGIRQTKNISYTDAFRRACNENPELYRRYDTGEIGDVRKYDRLNPADRELILLQNDPVRAQYLAGAVLDHHAKLICAGTGTRQESPETYKAALMQVRRANPSLAQCADNGFIGSGDYATLALLAPSVAKEVERRGIQSRVEYAQRTEVKRYSRDHVHHDGSGNEFRVYTLDVKR